jgi:phospholipase/carboxylesterase
MNAATQIGLVILLHGVGSNGRDMLSLANLWQNELPKVSFEAPDAPYSFDHGAGFQWFSVNGVTTGNRASRIVAARTRFNALVGNLVVKHQLQDQLESVILVGFSQGAIMALDAVATGRWPVGAVVALSGRLASPEPLAPAVKTPVLLLHGADDAVIPAAETTYAEKILKSYGVSAESHIYPGLGHSISTEESTTAIRFISQVIKR